MGADNVSSVLCGLPPTPRAVITDCLFLIFSCYCCCGDEYIHIQAILINRAPSLGSQTKKTAFECPLRWYTLPMWAIVFATASLRTRVTVHPPNPPPHIREPSTPGQLIAASTSMSNSLQETSKSSRNDLCEPVIRTPIWKNRWNYASD